MAPRRHSLSRATASEITDDILRDTDDPNVLAELTSDQLYRRRKLRKIAAAQGRARRRELAKQQRAIEHESCDGITEAGTSCQNRHVIGSDFCMAHMEDPERRRLGLPLKPGYIPKKKAPELLRSIVEENALTLLRPYFKCLALDLKGFDEEGHAITEEIPGGGLKLYGESKDGDIEMSIHDDDAGQVAVAEKLFDRVYGKPRQSTVIEGGVTPVRIQPVRSEDRALQVAAILAEARALPPAIEDAPHEGRRRREPAEIIDLPERS